MAQDKRYTTTICGGNLGYLCLCLLIALSCEPAIAQSDAPSVSQPSVPLVPSVLDNQSDYLDSVLKAGNGKVFRFRSMPIPVYVSSYPDKSFIAAVLKGFDSWESLSGGTVRFMEVNNESKCRIHVVLKRMGTAQDETGVIPGAHTITKYAANGKVLPQVIEVNLDMILSKSPDIRFSVLTNVVTHELGHALGLLGHSTDRNDMMFSVTDEHSHISQRDISTLTKLYQRKPDVAL